MIDSAFKVMIQHVLGLSSRNVRGEVAPADVEDLAANIASVGLLQPLIVEQAPDEPFRFVVVDGGRRFVAIRQLVEAGTWSADDYIPVIEIGEADGDPREISLAANILRRDLHPVDEFEAFAKLAGEGFTVERIAADFGRSVRFVRQRLAFDRLSPRVRALWRSGKLTSDLAAAFTKAADQTEQDNYLDDVEARRRYLSSYDLERAFGKDGGIRADRAEALYVGLDAYVAAGGTIDDNLFQDWSILEDAALVDRLMRKKMMDDGALILERTGFGTCLIERDVERSWDWGKLPVDLTPADREAISDIGLRETELRDTIEDDDELEVALETLADEHEQIVQRAVMRGSTAEQRATATIFLSLDSQGRLKVQYGRTPPRSGNGQGAQQAADRPHTRDDSYPAPAPEPERKPTKAVIECLDDARTQAFAVMIAERPMLAVLLCTAALRTSSNRSPLRIAAAGRNGSIPEPPFTSMAAALRELTALDSQPQLLDAFARAVAQTVAMVTPTYERNGGRADPDQLAGLVEILAHYTGEAYEETLGRAISFPAYFTAATRAAALAAIEETGGDVNAARKQKADVVAKQAAELARDKAWLPKELRAPPPMKRPAVDLAPAAVPETLADAMVAAIEADEDALPYVSVGESAVAEFLSWACVEDQHGDVSAAELFEAFRASAKGDALYVKKQKSFDEAMHGLGFRKEPWADGELFVGLSMATPYQQAAE